MNIDMIEVIENNLRFIIYPKKKQVLINNAYYPITEEKIQELISIISTWDNEYGASRQIDGNYFEVNVHYDGKIDTMRGIRGMPKNYEKFANYVRSIYARG